MCVYEEVCEGELLNLVNVVTVVIDVLTEDEK